MPFQIDPNTSEQGQGFFVAARLKPGVTLEQAKERLQTSAKEYRTKFPQILGPNDGFTVKTIREFVVSNLRILLLVLTGAVCLVLLIACANVANLLLVRAAGRQREIGIRVAIGAGRGRVIRQLLTESVLLSLAGGALGLFLGYGGIQALLASSNADELPPGSMVGIDWHVMGFALALSLLTGLVFGLLPALQGSRVDLNTVLKDSGGRWGTGLRQNKARAALVISEVSLAMVLLVGSALLIRTFVALYKVDRGFETKNVITLQTSSDRSEVFEIGRHGGHDTGQLSSASVRCQAWWLPAPPIVVCRCKETSVCLSISSAGLPRTNRTRETRRMGYYLARLLRCLQDSREAWTCVHGSRRRRVRRRWCSHQ